MYFLKKHATLILGVLSSIMYFFFAYQVERTQFNSILVLWVLLFFSYYYFIKNTLPFRHLVAFTVLFRIIFLLAIPNLSQDFYRFIWDGRMIYEGLNPYLYLPENFITSGKLPIPQAEELYKGMGIMNGSHYTNYPPINQLCFFIASIISNKSILGAAIVMRSLIIFADVGILYFGSKLLKNINKNKNLIFIYLLNPFIIIELTGNLHFETVMLFFLIWSLYLLQKRKWVLAAIVFALSISVKLIPLIFLPLFLKWFLIHKDKIVWKNFKKLITFYLIIIIFTLVLFLPFFSKTLISNYANSVGLWFRNFEFNASFYYLFREVGYLFRGYNEIAVIGKIIPLLTIAFLLIVTFFKKNNSIRSLTNSMLIALSFYYFTTTTMHPWYIATLIILSVFTNYRYPVIWSFVVILSYQAYANTPWKENLWFVFLEYLIVYGFLFYEIKKTHSKNMSGKNCYEKEKESGL